MNPRILIVEDDPSVRVALLGQLASNGYSPEGVASGEEAILKAQSEAPDVILLDLGLPGMSGWETLQRLQDDSQTRQIPAVILTAHSMPEEIIRGYAAGAVYFIPKPYDLAELLRGLKLARAGAE
jgi:CheY-like chemotaxis protein